MRVRFSVIIKLVYSVNEIFVMYWISPAYEIAYSYDISYAIF